MCESEGNVSHAAADRSARPRKPDGSAIATAVRTVDPAQSNPFATLTLPTDRTMVAPDGSDVRVLLKLSGGSMAHFQLGPGMTSRAVQHRTVDEIWYVLSGHGEMWRKQDQHEETVPLEPGTCLTIPVRTLFQFRASPDGPVSVVAITMPPWPGEGEAVAVAGRWSCLQPQIRE